MTQNRSDETAPETSELRSFVQVVDVGSISAAAQELGLPRTTVSRRLARLENRLGVKLLHRTTRQLQLSEAGEALYQHATGILQAVDAAAQAVARNDDTPRGLLRIASPPMSEPGLREMLVSFAVRFPEVQVESISSNRHEDLIAHNIDVAWRAGIELDPHLIARRLVNSKVVAVASPTYLQRAGVPQMPDELRQHDCLVGFEQGVRPATHWPLRNGGRVAIRKRFAANDIELLANAARQHLGIALVPLMASRGALERGELVTVLPETVGAISQIALVYPDRRLLNPAVRAFVDHVVTWMAGNPSWSSAASEPLA